MKEFQLTDLFDFVSKQERGRIVRMGNPSFRGSTCGCLMVHFFKDVGGFNGDNYVIIDGVISDGHSNNEVLIDESMGLDSYEHPVAVVVGAFPFIRAILAQDECVKTYGDVQRVMEEYKNGHSL